MRIEDVPKRFRDLHQRAIAGKSRKAAIRAHCLMCVGWVTEEVEQCTAPTCPLYPYRSTKAAKQAQLDAPGSRKRSGPPRVPPRPQKRRGDQNGVD